MNKRTQTFLFLSILLILFSWTYITNENKRIEKLSDPDYLTDAKTGYIWQNTLDDEKAETWDVAHAYCQSLNVDGIEGTWSLPTKTELFEVYQLNSKFKKRASWLHWSSTPVEGNKNSAYCVNFDGGMILSMNTDQKAHIKCVNRHAQ